MSAGQNASLGVANSSLAPPTTTISDREQIKIEFYHTYDVMTGVRIAATLGGFFSLMVILVVYKSKSKTEKALENPNLAAAAVAQVEEEDQRQIQAALEASGYGDLNPKPGRRSLDSTSPASWVRSTTRFSSVGGYSSLMEPPVRTPSRLPCFIDEDSLPEDEFEDLSTYNRYLDVPRRSSNITCSSSDSSYLERRGSSVILGLPAVPAHKSQCGRRRQSSPLPEQYDFYYPIDIRVIQPTPGGSPCGSERALYDNIPAKHPPARRAPLASISSCNSSLGADYPDFELQSLTSDSVFHEDDCPDTEDEADPFSTDSETSEERDNAWCRRDSKGSFKRRRRPSLKNRRVSIPCISENIPVISENRENDFSDYRPSTSAQSTDECRLNVAEFRVSVSEHDLNCSEDTPFMGKKSFSEGRSFKLDVQGCLPSNKSADSLTLIASGVGSTVTLPTLPLVEKSPSTTTLKKEEGSWSQETLF